MLVRYCDVEFSIFCQLREKKGSEQTICIFKSLNMTLFVMFIMTSTLFSSGETRSVWSASRLNVPKEPSKLKSSLIVHG